MAFRFSQRSLDNRAGVDERLIAVSDRAMALSVVDFGIPSSGGLRTVDQQKALFKSGHSNCDGVVKKSRHQSGAALDFYAYVDGRASWSSEHLCLVAAAHLQAASELGVALQWGGLWTAFRDLPHIELLDDTDVSLDYGLAS